MNRHGAFEPDLLPALGLLLGAALGTVIVLLVDATLLSIGTAFGAALGLIAGAILRAHRIAE